MPKSRLSEARTLAVEGCAERVLRDNGIAALPVDPIELAQEQLGILVEPKPTPGGVSGMLIHHGGSFAIVYSSDHNTGFQRFSVAHELGHYSIDGHIDGVFGVGESIHQSRAGFSSSDRYEREADTFAAALLMPSSLVIPILDAAGEGLAAVESMQAACATSLTSSAIRYSRLTEATAAIVVSKDGLIDYYFPSKELQQVPSLPWLRKGDPLPSGTATASFCRDRGNVRNARRKTDSCDLSDWFGCGPAVEFCEEVVGLGGYERTLTVLWTEALPEDWDDED